MRGFWLTVLCPRLAVYCLIALVVFLVLGAIFILSGSDLHSIMINMTGALSGALISIIVFEVLRKKVEITD